MSDTPEPQLIAYAAEIAPVVDDLQAAVQRAVFPVGKPLLDEAGVPDDSRGVLIGLRFVLPYKAVKAEEVLAVFRYQPPAEVHAALAELVATGWLTEAGGKHKATEKTKDLLNRLYDVFARMTAPWDGPAGPLGPDGAGSLADLVGRVLGRAGRDPGPAFAAVAPPFERAHDGAGIVLYHRLCALRYDRADAHAAAWAAAGLTVEQVTALDAPDPDIERATNEAAARSFAVLDESGRTALLSGLRSLPAPGA